MIIDPSQFRDALGRFATGITVITGLAPDGKPVGATANAFTSLSLDPPLILICLAKSMNSLSAFVEGEHFAINILKENQRQISVNFATQSADKFSNVVYDTWPSGVPILGDCLVNLECAREAVHDGGDHKIIVGRILRLEITDSGEPLLFYRGAYNRIALMV
jgi:flavin reductase (DIM6/NTAB) family NADH-FMN oxidoreductase RutF